MGIIKALMMIDGIAEEEVPELLVLHTFQTDIDAQLVGEVNGGFHHHLGALVLQDLEDKALVDFQTVHGQVADQIQGG